LALSLVVAFDDVLKKSNEDELNVFVPQPPNASATVNSAAMFVPFRIICFASLPTLLASFLKNRTAYSKPSVATPRRHKSG
jgi:hypothetical protein